MRCESFKLYLEPKTLRNETADPQLPRLPVRLAKQFFLDGN